MLEGFDDTPGLRHIPGVTVQMDGRDLSTRDLILGIEFLNLSCEQAVADYEKHGIIAFERALTSIYSRRMVEAFDSNGMVRLSPLHVSQHTCRNQAVPAGNTSYRKPLIIMPLRWLVNSRCKLLHQWSLHRLF